MITQIKEKAFWYTSSKNVEWESFT